MQGISKTGQQLQHCRLLGNLVRGISKAFVHWLQGSYLGFWNIWEMLLPRCCIGQFILEAIHPQSALQNVCESNCRLLVALANGERNLRGSSHGYSRIMKGQPCCKVGGMSRGGPVSQEPPGSEQTTSGCLCPNSTMYCLRRHRRKKAAQVSPAPISSCLCASAF